MKVIDCIQGSEEWHRLRAGIPTSSQFHRIVTPARLEPSKAQEGYIAELLAESYAGTTDFFEPREQWWQLARDLGYSDWMDRGLALEEEARNLYTMMRDTEVEKPGFIMRDDERTGCSPDGWVAEDEDGPGGVEIKCRAPKKQIELLFQEAEIATPTQIQGSMLITGAEWWDTFAFCPGFGPVLIREYRNPEICEILERELNAFLDKLEERRDRLDVLGMDGLTLARGPLRESESEEMAELVEQRIEDELLSENQGLAMLMARNDLPNTARLYLRWLREPGKVRLGESEFQMLEKGL